MNTFLHLIQYNTLAHAAAAAASAVVVGLWQGVLLTLLTALFFKLLPRTTATARFIVWAIVFAASVAMPLFHLIASTHSSHSPISVALPGLRLGLRWSYILAAVWIAAAIFRLTMLGGEVFGLRHLWLSAEPVAEEKLRHAGLLAAVAGCNVGVCTSSEIDRPSVIGFFAPKILIPDWLFAQLSEVEFQHIVLHEMQHLRRRDDWLNLWQKIGLVVFPLNPALFWIDRRLSTEREIACDDGVLARTSTPRAYASSLTSVAERRLDLKTSRRMVSLALGAFGPGKLLPHRSEFGRRIDSILGQRTSGSPAFAALLVMAVLGCAAAMSHAPELVSFGTPPSPNAAEPFPSVATHFAASQVAASQTAASQVVTRPIRAPHFQNANFSLRTHSKIESDQPDARPATLTGPYSPAFGKVATLSVRATADSSFRPSLGNRKGARRITQPEWLLLPSWEQSTPYSTPQDHQGGDPVSGDVVLPVSRVIVRTPDGKFFVAPYAALPTQAGWLIVQL